LPPARAARWVREFKAAGVPCASPAFLVDWVAHPFTRLAGPSYWLHGTRPGRALAALEAARRQGGAAAGGGGGDSGARSMSF
jgi:hypothetical protein